MIQPNYEIVWQASERLRNLRKEAQAYNELRKTTAYVPAQPVIMTIIKNPLSKLQQFLAKNKRRFRHVHRRTQP